MFDENCATAQCDGRPFYINESCTEVDIITSDTVAYEKIIHAYYVNHKAKTVSELSGKIDNPSTSLEEILNGMQLIIDRQGRELAKLKEDTARHKEKIARSSSYLLECIK